jgi:hypothetical protein
LRHVDYVFERERMQAEDLSNCPDGLLVSESLDINPGDDSLFKEAAKLPYVRYLVFGHLSLRVSDDPDDGLRRVTVDHQRSGPCPDFGMTLAKHLCLLQ